MQVRSMVVKSRVIPWQDLTFFSKFEHANFVIMIKMCFLYALCTKKYIQIVLLNKSTHEVSAHRIAM